VLGLEAVSQALRLLRAHKGRAVLTMFGLVWGTAAVIFLVGWGEGVTAMLELGFFKTGKNLAQAWAGRIGEDFTPAVDRRYLWFTIEDVEALRRRARLPELIGAETRHYVPVVYQQKAFNLELRGIDGEVMAIRGVPVAAGRGIRRSDIDHRRRVVLLGDTTRRRLLGAKGGVGSWIRLDGKPFKVIGVLQKVGVQLNRDGDLIDEQAWIPITTLQANWPRWWTDEFYVRTVLYRLRDRHLLEETEEEVRAILAERLGVPPTDQEAVIVWSPVAMLNRLPLDEIRGLLFILSAATLIIGGIGTLNMMLDSVHERRHEIGVRLAVGARQRDIVRQFFLETFTIVAMGGLAGVALGVGGCLLLGSFQVPDLIPVPVLSGRIVALALAVMSAVGVTAGVVPAWRAARVDPAQTLRME
jgi:putative ABC transport system permease protein